jgi:hypothetical protein
MGLEWLPSDGGKRNRSKILKSLSSGSPSQYWYGPHNPNPNWMADLARDMVESEQADPYDPDWAQMPDSYDIDDPLRIDATAEVIHSGIMLLTPEEYEDDVNAAIFYGSLGLYDPTNIADVPFWKARGWSTPKAFGLTLLRATLPAMLLGWWIDPLDKREGGLAETDWYEDVTDPGFWFGPGKWY